MMKYLLVLIVIFTVCSREVSVFIVDLPFSFINLSLDVVEEKMVSKAGKMTAVEFDTVYLYVSGEGMEQIDDTLIFDGENRIESILEVPAGLERLFKVVTAELSTGRIYAGSTMVDLEEGTEVDVEISLRILPAPPIPPE